MNNSQLSTRSFFHRNRFFHNHRPFSSIIHRSPRSERNSQQQLISNIPQQSHSNFLEVPNNNPIVNHYAFNPNPTISPSINSPSKDKQKWETDFANMKIKEHDSSLNDQSSNLNKAFYEGTSKSTIDSSFLTQNSTNGPGLVGINVLDSQSLKSDTSFSTQDSMNGHKTSFRGTHSPRNIDHVALSRYSHGLPNLGNTCYMNSVLQCLFNTEQLYKYFIESGHIVTKSDAKLTSAFGQIFSSAFTKNITERELETPLIHFKEALEKVAPIFKGYSQNDAHEFFRLLIEKIHDELNIAPKQSEAYEEFEPSKEVRYLAQLAEEWKKYSKDRDSSLIMKIFGGTLLNEVICKSCTFVSYTFEDALDLSLNISNPETVSSSVPYYAPTLYSSLLNFSAEEAVEGYTCTRCQATGASFKRTSIWKQPEILTVQFKRFIYDDYGRRSASKAKMAFPLDDLNMDSFTHGNSQEPRGKYKLYAIVNHFGTLDSGHYIAYIYNQDVKGWLKYNDNKITRIEDKEILAFAQGASEPYVLFYHRG